MSIKDHDKTNSPVTFTSSSSCRPVALFSTEASLCCREAGEKEKESPRGMMGKGEKEENLFPLPIVLRALSFFRVLLLESQTGASSRVA